MGFVDSDRNVNTVRVILYGPLQNESALSLSSSSPASFPDFPPSTSTSDWLAQRNSPDPASTHPADHVPENWWKKPTGQTEEFRWIGRKEKQKSGRKKRRNSESLIPLKRLLSVHVNNNKNRCGLFQSFDYMDTVRASLYLFLSISAFSVMRRRQDNTSEAGFFSDTPWLNRTCLRAALGLAPADVPLLTVAKSVTTFCFVRRWKDGIMSGLSVSGWLTNMHIWYSVKKNPL